VERRSGGAAVDGALVRLFDLRENLRLADDHAVEARGDAVEVSNRLALVERDDLPFNALGGDAVVAQQGVDEVVGFRGLDGTGAGGVELDAVARRQERELGRGEAFAPASERVARLLAAESELLAEIDAGGAMGAADHAEVHGESSR
jgi:hypothetical protein